MIFVLGFLCLMALLNFVTAIRLESAKDLKRPFKASLLIPLRNESERVSELLLNLSKSVSWGVEVILLDDDSTDDTWEKIKNVARRDFRLIKGKPLPKSWVGKSWACSQLAHEASGDVLIFCDADVFVSHKAVERTLSLMDSHQVDALTALPYQELRSLFEKAIIPFVMHLPILGLLPLRWVSWLKSPSLVVANGQWFAMKRSAYVQVGGHEAVHDSLLEDMELGRKLVREGFKVLPVLATKDIRVRMYSSWGALREGFTKNLSLLAGGRKLSVVFVFAMSLWIYLGPLFLVAKEKAGAGVAVLLLIFFRALCAVTFKVSPQTLWLHPLGAAGFLWLLFRSSLAFSRNQVQWRGREVQTANTLK